MVEVVTPSKVAWCPSSWCWPGQHNPFVPAAVGCPVCFTSQGQPPTWCDLWRCREMITKLLFEGVRRGIPGPTPSTGTNPRTGRGVSRRHPGRRLLPNFYMMGTNQRQNWPPLDGISMPSDKTSQTSLWNPHRRTEKGEKGGGVSAYLWRFPGETVSCGAAQFDPSRPPRFLGLGCFWPLATTGAIPRTGFQAPPCTVRCTVRDGSFNEHIAGPESVSLGTSSTWVSTLESLIWMFLSSDTVRIQR